VVFELRDDGRDRVFALRALGQVRALKLVRIGVAGEKLNFFEVLTAGARLVVVFNKGRVVLCHLFLLRAKREL
jgi:hypothetical protein